MTKLPTMPAPSGGVMLLVAAPARKTRAEDAASAVLREHAAQRMSDRVERRRGRRGSIAVDLNQTPSSRDGERQNMILW